MRISEGTERKTGRLEAFTDAVFAFAITLPVTRLEIPRGTPPNGLEAAYGALMPDYLSYGASVVVIGLYWAYSHFSGKIVMKTDHGFNLLTVLFLATVSITPFPLRPLAEHLLGHDGDALVAGRVAASILATPTLIWFVRWFYAVRLDMLDPHLAPAYVHKVTVRYAASAAVVSLGAAAAWLVSWRLGLVLIALVVLSHALPPMKPQFKPGQDPADELEEADERRDQEA